MISDKNTQRPKAVVRCINGHEWPLGTKFCGICGAKIAPTQGETRTLIVGAGVLGGEALLEYCQLPRSPESGESLIVVDTSPRDIAKLSENAALIKGPAPSFHLLSGQREETGKLWRVGDLAAKRDAALSEFLLANGAKSAESLFLIGSLKEGTASGAGPVILDRLTDQETSCSKVILGVIPAEDEPDLAHFNAYCGLSRFLRFKHRRNADFIVLLNERHVQENRQLDAKGRELGIAQTLASILGFITSPGSTDFTHWLGMPELPNLARLAGTIHAVPCLALNRSIRIFDSLTSLLESATVQPLAKVDTNSVVFAPVYLRVSRALKTKMKQEELLNEYNAWKMEAFGNKVGGEFSLAYVESDTDKLDALVLLGNCDLDKTLGQTIDGYQQLKRTIISRKMVGEESVSLEGDAFTAEDLLQIENDLSEYIMSLRALCGKGSTAPQG